MREIRFRYVFRRKSDGHIYIIEFKIEALEENNINSIRSMLSNNQWELIARDEYTGVKDENGKEIYEGDFLRSPDGIFHVKYFEGLGAFGFAFIADDGVEDFYDLSISDLSEVIGNIHGNPELLEKLK